MRGKIEQAKNSKSGKTLGVLIGQVWYSTKSWELADMVGQMIEFETSTSEFQGQTMHWLNDYGVVDNSQASGALNQPVGVAGVPAPAASVAGNDGLSYLPMTSNLVAHAIAAGVITDPTQIDVWARCAFTAAKRVVEGKQPAVGPGGPGGDEFQDDIPF